MNNQMNIRLLSAIEINPTRFYALASLAKNLPEATSKTLLIFLEDIGNMCDALDEHLRNLASANNALLSEVRNTTRRKQNPFDITSEEEYEDLYKDLRHTADGNNFLRVILEVIQGIQIGYHHIRDIAQNIRPAPILMVGKEVKDSPKDIEELQALSIQMSMNQHIISAFVDGILRADTAPNEVVNLGRHITKTLEQYQSILIHRHSTEGIRIHQDPITTDVAMSIFENVDSHGEIQDGKNPDEVSAYSVRKATIIANSIRLGLVGQFLRDPMKFIEFIKLNLKTLWEFAEQLRQIASPLAIKIRQQLGDRKKPYLMPARSFDEAITFIDDLDPGNVTFKEKTGLLTAEERHDLEFRNDTIREIVKLLTSPPNSVSTDDIIQYVLHRKAELRKYQLEENSFFVCKIGSGNPFTGDAPGQLQVVPGIKPNVNLDEVIGSGFKEVRDFIQHTLDGSKWFDLFLATSPSKKADKSNVLLVGPQGCHRKGQKILMFDGTLVPVEQIRVGDRLMGPDSKPRQVLSLHRGTEEMVEIIPTKGEPWVVNKGHVLTLVRTQRSVGKYKGRPKRYTPVNEVKDVAVGDYLGWSKTQKHIHTLFRVGVEFEQEPQPLPLEPYFLGVLLGDGCLCNRVGVTNTAEVVVQETYRQAAMFGLHVGIEDGGTSSSAYHVSGVRGKLNPITSILRDLGLDGCDSEEKFIPYPYKTASREERLELLAGLIDTDGSLHANCLDYNSKSKELAEDIAFLARSLGLAAYVSPCRKKAQTGVWGDYFRVSISGDTDLIPTRLDYKQASKHRQVKNVLRTNFTTRELPPEDFYGFTVDGDHRYLLGDFTVTHNCGKTEVLRAVASDRKAVGLFAQASDFLTCWKGESEKNPKRMFEEGLRIQREAKKQVFFLIDEIDTILNGDRGQLAFGSTNLATEFQVLMDGITSYPNLCLWGATNNPDRIPMPLIRRFSKVVIVGELTQKDRVALLKHFVGYLPICPDFPEQAWQDAAQKLDGAVGDIIRKVVDQLWREKMSWFVNNNRREAESVLETLNEGGQRFQIKDFDRTRRAKLHEKLRPFVQVKPQDLMTSVDLHLDNIAIRSEIETAKATYEAARKFLSRAEING